MNPIFSKALAAPGIRRRSIGYKRSLRSYNKNDKKDNWLTFSAAFITSLPSYFFIPFYISLFFLFYPEWDMEQHLIDEAGWKGGD